MQFNIIEGVLVHCVLGSMAVILAKRAVVFKSGGHAYPLEWKPESFVLNGESNRG
jgi:hypothetical protein